MVLAGKIFEVKEEVSLEEIALKLKNYTHTEIFKTNNEELEILIEIKNISLKEKSLSALFNRDKPIIISQRGKRVPVIKTIETPIIFDEYNNRVLLFVLQEKHQANAIASILSQILFMNYASIVEARISSDQLKDFHEKNPEGTKVIFFHDLDIPGVRKLSLYGETLKNTSLYEEYLRHGKILYIVYTSTTKGWVFGLTYNCVVTAFSKIEEKDLIDYVREEIYPLISR